MKHADKRNRISELKTSINYYDSGKPILTVERQRLGIDPEKGLARIFERREYALDTPMRATRVQRLIDAIIVKTRSGHINSFISTYHMTVMIADDVIVANNENIRERARQTDALMGTNSEWTFRHANGVVKSWHDNKRAED